MENEDSRMRKNFAQCGISIRFSKPLRNYDFVDFGRDVNSLMILDTAFALNVILEEFCFVLLIKLQI